MIINFSFKDDVIATTSTNQLPILPRKGDSVILEFYEENKTVVNGFEVVEVVFDVPMTNRSPEITIFLQFTNRGL